MFTSTEVQKSFPIKVRNSSFRIVDDSEVKLDSGIFDVKLHLWTSTLKIMNRVHKYQDFWAEWKCLCLFTDSHFEGFSSGHAQKRKICWCSKTGVQIFVLGILDVSSTFILLEWKCKFLDYLAETQGSSGNHSWTAAFSHGLWWNVDERDFEFLNLTWPWPAPLNIWKSAEKDDLCQKKWRKKASVWIFTSV